MDGADHLIKKIGERIVRLRTERGLKQIELANRLNIEDSALRRIEKGRTNPTIKTLYLIAQELKVPVAYLIDES